MRIARVLLFTALAAVAFSASPAMAQHGVTIVEEHEDQTEEPCAPVCTVHITGIGPHSGGTETELKLNGGVISQCIDEFEGTVNANGEGELNMQELNDGPSNNCNVTECAPPENDWPVEIREVAGVLSVATRFCITAGSGQTVHCNLNPGIDDLGSHHYIVEATNLACTNLPVLSVNGRWEIEGHGFTTEGEHHGIEIVH